MLRPNESPVPPARVELHVHCAATIYKIVCLSTRTSFLILSYRAHGVSHKHNGIWCDGSALSTSCSSPNVFVVRVPLQGRDLALHVLRAREGGGVSAPRVHHTPKLS
jgi:hypothetical protein